jgi:hypothetical protein
VLGRVGPPFPPQLEARLAPLSARVELASPAVRRAGPGALSVALHGAQGAGWWRTVLLMDAVSSAYTFCALVLVIIMWMLSCQGRLGFGLGNAGSIGWRRGAWQLVASGAHEVR